jgi:NAD(P)-dependent dehydrogenase (short-subunit alcohol dehydrogenase family)
MQKTIVVLGATGNLGGKIVDELLKQNAIVKVVVRLSSDKIKWEALKTKGVYVNTIDINNFAEIVNFFTGAHCIVSALAGLQDTITDAQLIYAKAAMEAGVPRFIASDYCSDYTNLVPGKNRNLDMRRDFANEVNKLNIKTTGIFNGAFMDMLTAQMPLIMYKQKKILCWGNPNQQMDFTHTLNVAAFTAQVALADDTPRYLTIAGDTKCCNEFVGIASRLSGKQFKLFRPGGIGLFNFVIATTKLFVSGKNELYPPWQGMQYMRDMMEGRIDTGKNNNGNYTVNWINIEKYLFENAKEKW